MLYHPTAFPDSTEGKQNNRKNRGKKRNLTRHSSHMHTPLDWGGDRSTISKAIFNEPLPLSIYQNGIRTALSGWGEGRWENGGTWLKEKKVFIKDSEVEVGGESEGGRLKWSRNASPLLLPPPNQGAKVMPVRAVVIPANPSSRRFIRFGIWLSALIRCSNGHSVNNWRAADNEKRFGAAVSPHNHAPFVSADTSALKTLHRVYLHRISFIDDSGCF